MGRASRRPDRDFALSGLADCDYAKPTKSCQRRVNASCRSGGTQDRSALLLHDNPSVTPAPNVRAVTSRGVAAGSGSPRVIEANAGSWLVFRATAAVTSCFATAHRCSRSTTWSTRTTGVYLGRSPTCASPARCFCACGASGWVVTPRRRPLRRDPPAASAADCPPGQRRILDIDFPSHDSVPGTGGNSARSIRRTFLRSRPSPSTHLEGSAETAPQVIRSGSWPAVTLTLHTDLATRTDRTTGSRTARASVSLIHLHHRSGVFTRIASGATPMPLADNQSGANSARCRSEMSNWCLATMGPPPLHAVVLTLPADRQCRGRHAARSRPRPLLTTPGGKLGLVIFSALDRFRPRPLPPALAASIDAPADARSGAPLRFIVRLRNISSKSIDGPRAARCTWRA